jgi:hypothetical protein
MEENNELINAVYNKYNFVRIDAIIVCLSRKSMWTIYDFDNVKNNMNQGIQ